MNDRLPNFYNVKIEGFKITPYPDETVCEAFVFEAEGVEAKDAQTAVRMTIRKHWQACGLEETDTGDGWIAYVGNDEDEPWLELEIDDYGDFATAVPYERRLALAGVRPLGFVS